MSKEVAPKTKAVIYVRVSSDRQVDNMSLGEQERICIEFCQRKELTVVRVFREKENLQRLPIGLSYRTC